LKLKNAVFDVLNAVLTGVFVSTAKKEQKIEYVRRYNKIG
jgi:hypothetical protein